MLPLQTFTYTTCAAQRVILQPGTYRLEVWGASGGTYRPSGGLGGYSKGELTVYESTDVFVNVGQQGGSYTSYNCNGGGRGGYKESSSGGGATDIRLISNSLYSRIIVAGGGGGGANDYSEYGGYGGGLKGGDGEDDDYAGRGASQDSDTIGCRSSSYTKCYTGTFGYGGNSTYKNKDEKGGGGGGGGWFGGSASYMIDAGGGGSGYVLTSSSFKPSGYLLTDSKYFLKNAETFGGNTEFASPTSYGNEKGHSGNGYARITPLYPLPTATLPASPRPTPPVTPHPTPPASPHPTPPVTPHPTPPVTPHPTETPKATLVRINPNRRNSYCFLNINN
jgi:hypothetical protein